MKTVSIFVLLLLLLSDSASAQTKIDEYNRLIADDEYFHLANVAEKMKADDRLSSAVVISSQRGSAAGSSLRYFYGVGEAISRFGIARDRIHLIYAGEGPNRETQLWLLRPGEALAQKSGRNIAELSGRVFSRNTLYDYECLDCDRTPFIDQGIFSGGLEHVVSALKANPSASVDIRIGRVDFVSRSRRDQAQLRRSIMDKVVRSGNIGTSRVRIRFTGGTFAYVYLILPNRDASPPTRKPARAK